ELLQARWIVSVGSARIRWMSAQAFLFHSCTAAQRALQSMIGGFSIRRRSFMAQYVYTMRRVGKVVPPKRVILKDISLSFFPGAKIGVLGLNGSGKSSLLKIMAGADEN